MAAKPDIMKFRLAEMFSDSQTGKTSITKTIGTYLILWGSFIITFVILFREIEYISIVGAIGGSAFTIGAGLIAAKVFKPSEPVQQEGETTT